LRSPLVLKGSVKRQRSSRALLSCLPPSSFPPWTSSGIHHKTAVRMQTPRSGAPFSLVALIGVKNNQGLVIFCPTKLTPPLPFCGALFPLFPHSPPPEQEMTEKIIGRTPAPFSLPPLFLFIRRWKLSPRRYIKFPTPSFFPPPFFSPCLPLRAESASNKTSFIKEMGTNLFRYLFLSFLSLFQLAYYFFTVRCTLESRPKKNVDAV